MSNFKSILIGLVAAISLASAVQAGSFGIGVKGSYTSIDASGSETEETNKGTENSINTASVDNNAVLGSVFVEYSLNDVSWASAGNSFTLGIQHTPGKADVSDKTETRTDTETIVNAAKVASNNTRTQTAQAEVDNYNNLYVEVPVYGALYVKAGMSRIDVKTKETTDGSNGGSYGDDTLDGTNYGVGLKGVTSSNIIWKIAYEETNFDTLSLTSTTGNTLSADLDTSEVNLSSGYRF